MVRARAPKVYSIAAHRGFVDALVAGLLPRYFDTELGLSQLTLLLPSSRAARAVSEAFIRELGERGQRGLLMPRMVLVGDLDLAENLGPMLDPLGALDIAPAVEPTRRWLELAEHIRTVFESEARTPPSTRARLQMAREIGAMFDRLNAEEIAPQALLSDAVRDRFPDVAGHYQEGIWLFAKVQALWGASLAARAQVDASQRRNALFDHTARAWRSKAPQTPIIAAGVTSAAPALARLLRVVSELPQGAVVLPDLDLLMGQEAWEELGRAGQPSEPGDALLGRADAVTHPQYHLKLLLGRMGINRAEVEPWHRKGASAAPPQRSHAISSLFLPPKASAVWAHLPATKRRLSGVRLMQLANIEEEAQAVALMVREALDIPQKRVNIVTPDRALARRIAAHLARWEIHADDTAGRPLHLTPAGRLVLQLAAASCEQAAPVALIALLAHPLVRAGDERAAWLAAVRKFELGLRGPRPAPGLAALELRANKAGVAEWWEEVAALMAPLLHLQEHREVGLADALELIMQTAQKLAGEALWGREDGRALSAFLDDLSAQARALGTAIAPGELDGIVRDAMAEIAVRPPYGGHPRVAIYGLIESRMTRADLVICCGLNEGTWPRIASPEPLLAPPILRALGVPGADFRIGLAAHDLAGALGAPEVVLSRAERDMEGPTIPSRFLLRVEALLGDQHARHIEQEIPRLARALDRESASAEPYQRPRPDPAPVLRDVPIKVTALDRLLGDPYQFYASEILQLHSLEALDAEAGPAWQGTLVHAILERWHAARDKARDRGQGKARDRTHDKGAGADLLAIADEELKARHINPLLWGLWRPRLLEALDWVQSEVEAQARDTGRCVAAFERKGEMERLGVRIHGRADRIDRLSDGTLAIVDYKTGRFASPAQVESGFALQLGLTGLIARAGGFGDASGEPCAFEYWALKKRPGGKGFGFIDKPLKVDGRRSGLSPEDFLPRHEAFLDAAIARFIKGREPFAARLNPDYPGYDTYDQLMRLDEWERNQAENNGTLAGRQDEA